jgi:hypothetical protein
MYRQPAGETPRALHEAERLDLFGDPLPAEKCRRAKAAPLRSMHRRAEWEDGGGWDDDELDGWEPGDPPPTPRPEPELFPEHVGLDAAEPPGCPSGEAVADEFAATGDADRAVRNLKVRALAYRHARRMPLHRPGDTAREPDYVGGVLRLLAAMARQQLADACPIVPPKIEVDRSKANPRYRLRRWQVDRTDPTSKRGRWVNLGSYPSREAAEHARTEWLRERGADVRRDLPDYLAELVPGRLQSNALAASRGEGFFAV